MKKMSIKNFLLYLTLLLTASLTGCDAVYDDEGDCSVTYQVRFRYDMNMKYADAFPNEVGAVALYVLDSSNNVVWKGEESGSALAEEGYAMNVSIAPGKYKLLAWCTTNKNNTYTFTTSRQRAAGEITCYINGEPSAAADDDDTIVTNKDLDALYHGLLTDVEFTTEPGVHTVTVPLTKDTNRFRIVLQHVANTDIDVNQFSFEIQADNSFLDYDNSVIEENDIVYYPWHTSNAVAAVDDDGDSATAAADEADDDIQVKAAVAELTVSRLVVDDNPHLIVRNVKTGEKVFSVPVKDYVLLVKGYENKDMSDQEYLDRQDEYNMTFFLDERDRWISAYIYINSWRVILQNTSF